MTYVCMYVYVNTAAYALHSVMFKTIQCTQNSLPFLVQIYPDQLLFIGFHPYLYIHVYIHMLLYTY